MSFSVGAANVKEVRWEGDIDWDMLKTVREDLRVAKASKVTTLRVDLAGPGGSVNFAQEISRIVRDASDAGLIVEMHAAAMCMSGCTLILASGTPGHRYMSKWAMFMVHPPQHNGECLRHTDNPLTQDQKTANATLDLMRDHYMRYTNQSKATVEKWLTCGNENVGSGALAVALHVADAVE